jgi:hypothetical protein
MLHLVDLAIGLVLLELVVLLAWQRGSRPSAMVTIARPDRATACTWKPGLGRSTATTEAGSGDGHAGQGHGRILGAGMVGTHAGDMIGEIALTTEMGADAVDIGKTIHPHPTLGESIGIAAEVAHGSCTDLPPARK